MPSFFGGIPRFCDSERAVHVVAASLLHGRTGPRVVFDSIAMKADRSDYNSEVSATAAAVRGEVTRCEFW
jgi:hypothetical protein